MSEERFCKGACEHCGQHIEFPAEAAGLTVACPHCSSETMLLETAGDLAADIARGTEEITAAELSAAFNGTVPRCRISVFYQAGLLVVAFFMLLLPIAYMAFAAFAGYCVYWYAIHAKVIFSGYSGSIHLMILKVIAYAGPIAGGAVAVFFMFKPLLARRPKQAEPVELNPAQHPRLYQLIAHTSEVLRAPMPKRIYLDCSTNAGGGFRRGWLGIFGNEPVLTLGLPLAAGLNTRQFAALVAHELGHCTQALAMRLGYVIDGIDGWFVRVIYARDTWDEALEDWANSVEDWRSSLIVGCVRLSVWFSRKILTLLMYTGHAASCFLSRQMEYHADACAMAVAGSDGLESLLIRLRELSVLEGLAYNGLTQIWKKRHQLPGSLPGFLEEMEKRLPAGFHDQARNTLLNETAGLFATHPTAARRIQKSRQRAQTGIFMLEKPASALFNDFPATSRLVTGRHYRQTLRLPVTDPMLKPVAEFFTADAAVARAN